MATGEARSCRVHARRRHDRRVQRRAPLRHDGSCRGGEARRAQAVAPSRARAARQRIQRAEPWPQRAQGQEHCSIKAALLDQRIVAGLGNIYVSEALYGAKLSPRRSAGTVQGARADALARAIRDTLTRAIAAGGSSLRDYVQASGELGYFQHQWAVYGKEGEKCPPATAPGHQAHRAERALDLLLRETSEVRRTMAYENILVETKGAVGIVTLNRPKALNALCAALVARARPGARRLRGRRRHRLRHRHRQRQGVRRRRRHQGDGGAKLYVGLSRPISSPRVGNASPPAASRSSPRSPASRSAAAARSR